MVDPGTERPEHDDPALGQASSDDGGPDIFERRDSVDSDSGRAPNADEPTAPGASPADDVQPELPVELASLSDR
jgi:hypothetical protein